MDNNKIQTSPSKGLSDGAKATIIGARRIGNFAGPRNAWLRAAIISELKGAKVPKAKAGFNNFTAALAEHYQIDGSTMTVAAFEQAIMDAVKG